MDLHTPEWQRVAIDPVLDETAGCFHADPRGRASRRRCQRINPDGRQRHAKRGLPNVDSQCAHMLAV